MVNVEQCPLLFHGHEDGIAERVFQARAPRIVELLECRDHARGDEIDTGRIGTCQRVERHDMFGGGVTSSLGSSGVAERNLNRITIVVSLVWFAAIVGLGLIARFSVV